MTKENGKRKKKTSHIWKSKLNTLGLRKHDFLNFSWALDQDKQVFYLAPCILATESSIALFLLLLLLLYQLISYVSDIIFSKEKSFSSNTVGERGTS